MIAASCLYLAGKVKDEIVKIRDVINVAYETMNRNSAPLELNDEYWTMRDSIVQAELLITRILKFDLGTVHSHKYLLYYMKTLVGWFGQKLWGESPIPKTSAAFLQVIIKFSSFLVTILFLPNFYKFFEFENFEHEMF